MTYTFQFYPTTCFDWNILISALIALIGFASLALSFWFNRKTLRQTKGISESTLEQAKELNDMALQFSISIMEIQNKISLFSARYELIDYLILLFNCDWHLKDLILHRLKELDKNAYRIELLFTNTKQIINACDHFYNYIKSDNPLPDFTKNFTNVEITELRHIIPYNFNDVEIAFLNYANEGIEMLEKDLKIEHAEHKGYNQYPKL